MSRLNLLNSKFRQWLFAGVIAVAVATSIAAGYLSWLTHTDDLRTKKEGAILQVAEFKSRHLPLTSIEFVEQSGRHLLCVHGSSTRRVWIMLDPQAPPFYKQLPMEQYTLTESEFSTVSKLPYLNETVRQYLRSHTVVYPPSEPEPQSK